MFSCLAQSSFEGDQVVHKLSADRAKFLFNYDPEIGSLTWRNPTAKCIAAGDPAGGLNSNGTRHVSIDGERIFAHHLVWLIAYGKLPDGPIAARNGDYDDLRLRNLYAKPDVTPRRKQDLDARRKDTRLRQLWQRTLRDSPDALWTSQAQFRQSIGDNVFPHCRVVPVRDTEPIGPNNFRVEPRAKFDRSTPEGRVAYYRDRNRTDKARYKNHALLSSFGITLSQYHEMQKAQNNLCANCKQPETWIMRGRLQSLSVDHCHATGVVRGLLCRACNNGLGMFRDNPAFLRSAAAYVEHYAEKHRSVPASNVIPLKQKER